MTDISDALTKIEAELAAATPDDLLHRVITAWDHEFTHPANSAVDIVQARIAVQVLRPTYLAALVEVARAAEVVRAVGWDGVSWFDHPEHKGSCITYADDELLTDALDKLNDALDALTKAVDDGS